jgi:hypothetical protein
MKYFNELLASYFNFNKRQSILIEQAIDDSKQKGDAAINQANATIPHPKKPQEQISKYPKDSPYIPLDAVSPIRMWRTSVGTIRWSPQGMYQQYNGYTVNSDIERFYLNFKEKKEKQEDILKKEENPNDLHSNSLNPPLPPVSFWNQDFYNQLLADPAFLRRVTRNLNGKEKEIVINGLLKRFKGDRANHSIFRVIDEHIRVIEDENGNLIDGKPDEKLKERVAKVLEDSLKILHKPGRVSDEDCNKLKNSLIPLTNGRFAIKSPEMGGKGLVFNDDTKFYSLFFGSAAASKGCDLNPPTSMSADNVGADNQLRGDIMEMLPVLLNAAQRCQSGRVSMKRCETLLDDLTARYAAKKQQNKEVFEKIKFIMQQNEGEFAIPIDNTELLARSLLLKIFGDDADEQMMKRIENMSAFEARTRNPDLILPIGDLVRLGRKGDNLELWETEEAARQGLKNQGFSDYEIDELIEEVDISELCSDTGSECGEMNKSKAKCIRLLSCPDITDKPYFTVNISAKNQINFGDGVAMGTVSENTENSVFLGEDCPPKEDRTPCTPEEKKQVKKWRQAMANSLGQPWMADPNSPEYKKLSSLQKELNTMRSNLDSLPERAVVKTDTGEIKMAPAEDYANTVLEELRKSENYSDFIDNDLKDIIQRYAEKDVSPEVMKAHIASYLEGKMLSERANKGDLAARSMIAMRPFLAGGSSDNAVLSARSMEHVELAVCEQNKLFDPIKRWLNNDPSIEFKMRPNGRYIQFTDTNTKARIQTETSIADSGRRVHKAKSGVRNLKQHSKRRQGVESRG